MTRKFLIAALFFACSNTSQAALLDFGSYTTDTSTGLDWLDVTSTGNLPFDEVSAQFGPGELFEGWRYATLSELLGFYASAGGPGTYNGFDPVHNSWVPGLQALWGLTPDSGGNGGDRTTVQIAEFNSLGQVALGRIIHNLAASDDDYAKLPDGFVNQANTGQNLGSALVRETINPVPLPAAAWLFGTAVIGFVGLSRRTRPGKK